MPVAVTVSTLMAVTLFMDSASARPAGRVSMLGHSGPRTPLALGVHLTGNGSRRTPMEGGWARSPYPSLPQVPAATCPALRASGEPTVATPVPARMGARASLRLATACVHRGSEALPARDVRPLPSRPQRPEDPRPLRLPALLAVHCQMPQPPLDPAWSLPLIPMCPQLRSGKEGGSSWDQGLVEGWPRPQSPAASPPACQPGRYGKRCVPCKCENHSSCHPSDGTCYCLAGWTGRDCSQRTCVVA